MNITKPITLIERLAGACAETVVQWFSDAGRKDGDDLDLSDTISEILNPTLEANNRQLQLCREALVECADDLEAEVKARWCTEPDGSCHPALAGKLERDLAPVVKARTLIASIEGVGE